SLEHRVRAEVGGPGRPLRIHFGKSKATRVGPESVQASRFALSRPSVVEGLVGLLQRLAASRAGEAARLGIRLRGGAGRAPTTETCQDRRRRAMGAGRGAQRAACERRQVIRSRCPRAPWGGVPSLSAPTPAGSPSPAS